MVDSNYDDGHWTRLHALGPSEVNDRPDDNSGSAAATMTTWVESATDMVHPRWGDLKVLRGC